jgi:transcriptional regulator with XRE-family HTH domain
MSTSLAIAKLRKKLDYTQKQFADIIGVTVVTVSRYENGREPAANVLQRLAHLAAKVKAKHLHDLFVAKLQGDLASRMENLPSAGAERRIPKFLIELWIHRQEQIFRGCTGLLRRNDLTSSERKVVLEGIRRSAETTWKDLRGFLADSLPDLYPNEEFSPQAALSMLLPVEDWMACLYQPPRARRVLGRRKHSLSSGGK